MKGKINYSYMVFLAFAAALGGILFGYDTAVISGTVSQVKTQFALTTAQSGWYVGCALIGSIIGVSFAGIMSDRLGRKLAMSIAAACFTVSAIGCCIPAMSFSFKALVAYRIVGGLGIGVVSIVCPLYISEVSAAKHRGTLVSMYQLFITVGFVLAYLVNFRLMAQSQDVTRFSGSQMWHRIFVDEVWRGMLGAETIPCLLFLIMVFFIPESPRWLIVRNRIPEARKVISRIYCDSETVEEQINATRATLKGETSARSEWAMLHKRGIMVAVLVGAGIAILGQFMGVNAVLYYGPTIFEQAGLSSADSLYSQVFVGLVNMVTTIIALLIIDKVGRKKLIYYGVSGMIVTLLCIAAYFRFGQAWGLSNTFLLVFFLLYIFCQAISISAVVFVLLSEMYPNKVRGLAMSIAGFALWIGTYLIGQLTPIMLEKLTPAGTFLFFALMCIPYILIMWKLVPETTGKSLEEIEKYWDKYERKTN
ncbi:MAG: sugar porter family MFS transporter [Bacteroidales bacterium]|jgi:sugar porter (SP) family MFS transporter|nr:sugar porter family MFS transporter [Bacteroidales bacterium]MCI2122212.1 sugar porter family MFS transporter [Bacteroidales bacterium]MCI2145776.1 sugar porter family MFS transporter [Bacteroidales bacterium]